MLLLGCSVEMASAASHKHKHKSKCQRLKGKDLAPAAKVKLVARKNADSGKDLKGCVLPRGKVRLVASSSDFYTTGTSYEVLGVKSVWVLIRASTDSQYGYENGTAAINLRTGQGYRIAGACGMLGSTEPCGSPPNDQARAAVFTRDGQVGAAIEVVGSETTTIAAFTSTGVRTDLDSGPSADIPAASLQLKGHLFAWINAGVMRSATLGG